MATNHDYGWYYLLTNGDLIWRRFEPDPATFVKKVWDMSEWAATREKFIEFLKAAHAAGADVRRIETVADKNRIGLFELGIKRSNDN